MHEHTVKAGTRSVDIQTPTHIDDHPSDDDWFKKNKPYIDTALNAAGVVMAGVSLVVTHKPLRRPPPRG